MANPRPVSQEPPMKVIDLVCEILGLPKLGG